MSEISTLYPRQYERVDGAVVGLEWSGREIPVPPSWVKDFTHIPQGTEAASLAAELQGIYPPEVRNVLVQYVKDWGEVRQFGHHLIIAGSGVTWKRRQWAAAATVNEIVMRFAQMMDVGQQFMSVPMIRDAMSRKSERYDSYASVRSKMMGAKLLLIEEPLRVRPQSDERYFIEDVYELRSNRKLPTITTLSVNPDESFHDTVRPILGPYVSEILQYHSKYIASY